MIQRIQTVYLIVSSILLILLFRLPLADILADGQYYLFKIKGIYKDGEQVFNGLPLLILLLIVMHMHFVAIALYKKRIKQMRMLSFSIFLLLGLFGMFFFFAYYGFENATVSFKIPVSFPVLAIILDYLAIRNIGKDEALVRSLDRLRP